MGIFDLFKKKKENQGKTLNSPDVQAEQETKPIFAENHANEPFISDELTDEKNDIEQEGQYLGNLEHTALIQSLLQTPRQDRGDEWVISFLSHVATASFSCGDPQVIQGPDSFPYFQMFLPKPAVPFQCYVIEKMIDDFLLENGFGIALEPNGGEVEWVLTYGDLLHYSVHKTFAYPCDHGFVKSDIENEVLDTNEQIMIGAPSESILPVRSREVIKSFLIAQGISEPKVCLIDRKEAGKGIHLVFNIVPWQFENENHYQSVVRALGWFLPGYYSYIGVKEELFKDGFLPL